MIFEKDIYFLTRRFILLNLTGTFILLLIKMFLLKEFVFLNSNLANFTIVIVLLLLQLFSVHQVELKNQNLMIKNILGITIKRIELKEIKSRKVKYRHIPLNMFNILFRKKYNRNCQIKYTLTKGSYSFNGHILSDKGLKQLLNKTRK